MNLLKNTYIYLDRFIRREIDYYRVNPTNLLLFLTYRCTSRCQSCTMWQRKTTEQEMTLEEWKHFIDMFDGKGLRNVEMFGGDALLRKEVLIPLTSYIRNKGIAQVDLVTNCNLMDEAMARDIVEAGTSVVYTSLDAVGELHDRIRGVPGSFLKLRESLLHLIRARKGRPYPKIVLNCTVSSLNVEGIEQLLPFAEEMGVDKVAFEYVGEFPQESVTRSAINAIVPEPYFIPQEKSILLNSEQARLLKKKIRDIKDLSESLKIRVSTKNIDALRVAELSSGLLPNRKCYVCRYLVTVDPFGNVLPCPFYNNYHLGNVRRQHIGEIWKDKQHREFINFIDEKKGDMCKYCILSVERNPTFVQSLRSAYFQFLKKGYDEE